MRRPSGSTTKVSGQKERCCQDAVGPCRATNGKKAVRGIPGAALGSSWDAFLEAEESRQTIHTGAAGRYAAALSSAKLQPRPGSSAASASLFGSPAGEIRRGQPGGSAPTSADMLQGGRAAAMDKKVSKRLKHIFDLGRRTAWKLQWIDAPASFKARRAVKDGALSSRALQPVVAPLGLDGEGLQDSSQGLTSVAHPEIYGKAAQLMCIYVLNQRTGDKHPLLVALRALVHDVKAQAASALGSTAPLEGAYLCVGGQRLDDQRTLLSYGVQQGECLHFMQRRGTGIKSKRRVSILGPHSSIATAEWLSVPTTSCWSGVQETSLCLDSNNQSYASAEAEAWWHSGFDSGLPIPTERSQPRGLSNVRQVVVRCLSAVSQQATELSLEVPSRASISELKRQIEVRMGVAIANQRLSLVGRALANDAILDDCAPGSEVVQLQLECLTREFTLPPNHYVRNARLAAPLAAAVDRVGIPISVNETWPGGRCYRVQVTPGQGMQRLMERLERWTDVPMQKQMLMHRGRILQGEFTTEYYNIKPGDRLDLACSGGLCEGVVNESIHCAASPSTDSES